MSGAHAVLVSGGGSFYSVTMADISSSGTAFGYNDGATPGGSISPTTFRSVTIKVVANNTTGSDVFTITLQGSRAQTFFTGAQIQKTNGSAVILYTKDATFSDLTTVTAWQWTIDGIWTAATPTPRLVKIF